jgi:hypothetical protein
MEMLTTTVRQLLLFGHTLAFAFAIVTVIQEDWALLRARRIDADRLEAVGRKMARLLLLLWMTGVALVLLDQGSSWDLLMTKSKLAAKLTVVSLLTVNGLVLHGLVFPMLTQPHRRRGTELAVCAGVCACVGAISSVTWLFASFLGVARLIAPSMTYSGFLGLYGLSLVVGVVVALMVVRPQIERLMLVRPKPRIRSRTSPSFEITRLSAFPKTTLLVD